MLRRTLLIFFGFVCLGLVLTLGYALLGFSGPKTALQNAQQAFATGRYSEAVRILDTAERDLGPAGHNDLRRQILEVRYRAHLALDNKTLALADLNRLVESHAPDEPGLALERYTLLVQSGKAEEAYRQALGFLDKHPDHGRATELAGEAAQVVYQERIAKLVQELRAKLAAEVYRDVLEALLPVLYRAADDPLALRGRQRFQEILYQNRPEDAVTGRYDAEIDAIRTWTAKAQAHFRRTLELPGQPVAAYSGLAFALRQGRRFDDLQALAEIYLRRFDHSWRTLAALDLGALHLDQGREDALLELVQRVAPVDRLVDLAREGRLLPEARRMLLGQAEVLWRRKDAAQLARLVAAAWNIQGKRMLDLMPEVQAMAALDQDLAGHPAQVADHLWWYVQDASVQAPPRGPIDAFHWAMDRRLRALEASGAPQARLDEHFALWIKVRPARPEAFLYRARQQVALGHFGPAKMDASRGLQLAGQDEAALRVRAEASEKAAAQSGQGAEALLAQCLTLGRDTPEDVSDDVLLLATGELALERGHAWIALGCARRAARLFNWARWPRLLQARAATRMAAHDEAARALETLLQFHPGDAEALPLLRAARRATGQSEDDLTLDLLLQGGFDPWIARRMLEALLARGELGPAQLLGANLLARKPAEAVGLLRVADVLARSGAREAALALLQQIPVVFPEDLTSAGEAALRYAALLAEGGAPEPVAVAAIAARELLRDRPARLVDLAEILAERRQPEAAYRVLEPALDGPVAAPFRNGRVFLLAGTLALAAGRDAAAERHLTAACTFADGRAAALPLAALLALGNRIEEAREVFRGVKVTDFAGAAVAARLRLGALAQPFLEAHLRDAPTDVAALALRALLAPGTEGSGLHEEIRVLATREPELLLDVLTLPAIAGLAPRAVALARALDERMAPQATSRFLLARALAAANERIPALETLTGVLLLQPGYVAAYDEMLHILERSDPARLADPYLVHELHRIVQESGKLATPRMVAVATRGVAEMILVGQGDVDSAVQLLGNLWVISPEASRAGVQEVETLILAGKVEAARQLLAFLEAKVPEAGRSAFYAEYTRLARAILARTPDDATRQRLLERAEASRTQYGAYGSLVHLIVDLATPAASGLRRPNDAAAVAARNREIALLRAHLDLFAAGKDPDSVTAVQSLERLARREGRAPVLARLHATLARDPSLVGLWILRARLLDQDGQTPRALRELRAVAGYLPDPALLTEVARIGAESGLSLPSDEDALARALAPAQADLPAVRYARGLLALRGARYALAEELLAGTEPRADGSHLYFRALANLPLPTPEAKARARELFAALAAGYPESPFQENSAHFAVQLGL